MKFLHTADWHIGIKAAHLGSAGPAVRARRLRSARGVIDAANARRVDFVLVAGDTFDDNFVSPDAVRETAAILGASAAPVYVIPGNHDCLCPGSVWERPEWGGYEKIHILTEERPVDIGPAVIYPCPVRERQSTADPTAWIPPARSPADLPVDKPRIALAHGSVDGLPQEEPDFPIPRGMPAAKGLVYAALGHWHSFARYSGKDGVSRMAYCGAHEATRFGRSESGFADVVTISGRRGVPAVEQIATAGLRWVDRQERVNGGEGIRAVMESLLAIDDRESALVRLELTGAYGAGDIDALDELRALGGSGRFLHFELYEDGLRFTHKNILANTGWIARIGEPLVRKTGERLAMMRGTAVDSALNFGDDDDDAGGQVDRAVLDRALRELYLIARSAAR
jgi:hypothetical protein